MARTNGIAVELAEEEDVFRLGRLVQGNLVYRQKFSIRSYEVGADMSGSIETMMNHLQVISRYYINIGTGNHYLSIKTGLLAIWLNQPNFLISVCFVSPKSNIISFYAGNSSEPCLCLY